jgi:hypothetical protein
MDANYEKRAIKKQNSKWTSRKESKRNIKKQNHPWYWTDYAVKSRLDKLANFDIHKNDIQRD